MILGSLTVMGETMLRVDNVKNEEDLEAVRDALDELGADYEHVDSEPDEDSFPQAAYFQVQSDLSEDADNLLARLSEGRRAACRSFVGLVPAQRRTVL